MPKAAKNVQASTPVAEAQIAGAAPANDEEMERIVSEAEKQFSRSQPPSLVDLIDANTRGVLTLFPYTPRNPDPEKTYPVVTGHLDTRHAKIPVSGFAKKSEEGRDFLSLSIGAKGQERIGGAIFRQEEQDPATGLWSMTPGKDNDRFGMIEKSVKVGDDAYEQVFELRLYGKRRLSGTSVPYIKAKVYPMRAAGEDDGDALDGIF